MLSRPAVSKRVVKDLQKICGDGVSTRENHRISYSRDCSTPSLIEIREGHVTHPPDLIVWPRSTEEVSRILKIASEDRIPLVPYGAGSGVCGGAVPLKRGIVLDLKKMDRILSIDSRAMNVTAQTGILGEILERELQKAGFTMGHFPASIYTATLGGFLACRSAGQLSSKFGKIEDMVRAMKVCLADGRILTLGEDTAMDLKELFLGSEGTLGVVTEATLKIHPQPEMKKYWAYSFPDLSRGLNAIRRFMQDGFRPAVVRLYDPLDSLLFRLGSPNGQSGRLKRIYEWVPTPLRSLFKKAKAGSLQWIASRSGIVNRMIEWGLSEALLILGFEGPAWRVKYELPQVMRICEQENGKSLGEAPGERWLERRYSVSYKMSPVMDQGCFADTMEVAAPWSRIGDLYPSVVGALRDEAVVMAHFSHVYPEGCSIYFTFVGYGSDEKESLERHRRIWDKGLAASLKAGATISHHHGIGYLKAQALQQELGPLMEILRKTKRMLDPHGILNPGKMGL